ncbi:fungal specific transcription factor domain-containing protein 70 [Elsinoe australis]|uniref:Fungal specific transcription factor domain-containing protein 70 n=1 Tax=Elsinoe australis TaxID=40998 RepID=A0A4V6DT27_9PEZI|nr:fungal specific transcription factor domain-containing protein 70 [Elsinoe australis]
MSELTGSSHPEESTTRQGPKGPQLTAAEPSEKPRSCVVCAQRKVRCDKQYPCGRCQRAGVTCVQPHTDHRPRWARQLAKSPRSKAGVPTRKLTATGTDADRIVDKLKVLERLVQDLSGELEQARTTPNVAASRHGDKSSGDSAVENASTATPQAGRTILDDSGRVRHVSSAYWSHIDHELDSFQAESRGNKHDGPPSTLEEARPPRKTTSSDTEVYDPATYNGVLFGHSSNLASPDAPTFFPLPSQIPFLLEVYTDRVHFVVGLPHMPSLKKVLQQCRSSRWDAISPSEEALVFSVFYTAICSLDEDEVITSFNIPKDKLALRYRTGLEHALAKADFLNNPTDITVETFSIYLALARRQESPKYVWMMTGLVIRMAQYLGIHHDSHNSKHITPFQAEMRRRIWWNVCALDMRATEDQGTELALPPSTYTTSLPSNVNDADIWPEMEQPSPERLGTTNVTLLRLCSKCTRATQEVLSAPSTTTVDDHNRRLTSLAQELESDYFGLMHASQDPAYLAAAGTMRVFLGRLTILAFLPVLHSSPGQAFSIEMRTKLLVTAIDVIEHNHALNCDPTCHPWKWIYQTQQHWHEIVYLLLEICQRSWSPTIERAWVALQSPWLVSPRAPNDKNSAALVPLRRLMARTRKHRENEVERLQSDPDAAASIERDDERDIPKPSSSTTFPTYFNDEAFHHRWSQLIRPNINSTGSTVDGADSSAFADGAMTRSAIDPGSSTHTGDMFRTATESHIDQSPQQLGDGVHSIISHTVPGLSTTFNNGFNLDTFLGTDAELGLLDTMTDVDFSDFDFSSWLDSARGVL